MANPTNNTNKFKGNEMNIDIKFLGSGIYDIVSVTKREGKKGMEFIAEVRRWNRTQWNNEIVNLSYLFSANSIGPMLKYQPETLIDNVINIKCSRNENNFFTYVWEVDTRLTEIVQNEIQESIDEFNYTNYEDEQRVLEDLEFLAQLEYDEYLKEENIREQEQELLQEEVYQEEMEYQEDLEISNMHDPENTEDEDTDPENTEEN